MDGDNELLAGITDIDRVTGCCGMVQAQVQVGIEIQS